MTADDAFDFLIAPISTATFFKDYFERDMLHVARGDAAYFADLYSVACVENALVVGAAEHDHFALIKDNEVRREGVTSERNTIRFRAARKAPRAVLDPRAILAAFADGQTLNITDATAYHPPLAQLCNRMQTQLGFFIQANAYFTPAHAQGFGVHYDTHDTLIVQIDGAKEWLVYEPVVPLPLEVQPFSPNAHDGKLGTPRTVRLEVGDSLYLPHGFPHAAKTAEQRSLHLTFALAPIRVIDLLDSLIQLAAIGDVELRRGLPPGWQRDPAFAQRFAALLAEHLPRAIAPDRIKPATDFASNELFAATRTTAAGTFDALAALEAIGAESRITLRDDTPFQLRERGETLAIVLAAKVVNVPANAQVAFALLTAGSATFAEVEATLPDGSGRAFVRTLVLEGLARVQTPTASLASARTTSQQVAASIRSDRPAVDTQRRVPSANTTP